MVKTASAKKRREQSSPAPRIEGDVRRKKAAPVDEVEAKRERRGLWVVLQGRMPTYGSQVIEGPGQVIRKEHLRNDDILIKHRYVRALEKADVFTQCQACGLSFLGDAISGPYKGHLAKARHDAETLDLDAGLKAPTARRHDVGDINENPDSDAGGKWDLEPDGAPPPVKIEQEQPRGVRVAL